MTTNIPVSPRIAAAATVEQLPEAPDVAHLQEGVIAELVPLGVAINDHGCRVHVLVTLEDELNLVRFAATVDLEWFLDLMPARVLMQPLPDDPGCIAHPEGLDLGIRKPIRQFTRTLCEAFGPDESDVVEDSAVEASRLLTWWARGGAPIRNTERFVEQLLKTCSEPSVVAVGEQLVARLRSLRRGQRPTVAIVTDTVAFLETVLNGSRSRCLPEMPE